MNPSRPFIERPIMTTLVCFAVLIVGLWAYFNLPVSNMPSVEYPNINVNVPFPGASPETMANNVATPLEREFLTIDGLHTVTSSNILGSTSIVLQFELNKNIDAAAQDVQAAISRALPNLPTQLPSAPTYRKVNPALTPIIILALTSETAPLSELYDYANTLIGEQLTIINGVAQVITYGSPFAVRVQVDPGKLATTGVTLLDISNALINGNPYLPTGFFDGAVDSPIIQVNGQLTKADEYNPLIVSYINNAPLRIEDLGKAVDSRQNFRYSLFYIDEKTKVPGVVLAILPAPGSNAVEISKQMHKVLPSIVQQLPASMDLRIVNDKTDAVQESLFDVQITLLIAFVLIVLIIFLYLGQWIETIIPALVIPLSVIGTFALMHLFGFNLDNLSLMALILAIGFIIDDAIVVIENIVRHVEAGERPWIAALEGSKQIGFTIVSMSLSLIAVFIPILLMGGLLGRILREFAVTLTTITVLSGIISLTLTPMLCSLFIVGREKQQKETFGKRLNQKMIDFYKPRLRWILAHQFVAWIILVISIAISFLLLIVLPKDFMPNDDIGFFVIYTQSEEGTSSERMEALQEEVTDIVRKHPSVQQFVSVAASAQFRNGFLYVRLKPSSQRKPILDVIHELNNKTKQLIGINTYYKNIPMVDLSIGTQVKGAYQYSIKGFRSKDLYPSAQEMIQKMRDVPGMEGVNSDLEVNAPQIYVDIPRDKASSLGIQAQDIELALDLAYSGGRVTRIQSPINQYDVILELEPKFQRNQEALNSIYLRSDISQKLVPLSAVAHWREGVGPTSINHINQMPAVTINYNLAKDASLGEVLKDIRKIQHNTLPKGIEGKAVGAAEAFEASIYSAVLLLIVTILAIYIILGVLYESYIHPITILTTLPPAILGGLLVLYLFDMSLSFYSFLGIILLIGIVKKNGIMMVDFALDNMRLKGEDPEKSIFDACVARFRPIMMTTLTAIFGALPLALGWGAGAEARRPLGLVIIGGLLLSQLITLFITPVVFLYMEKFHEKFSLLSAEKKASLKNRNGDGESVRNDLPKNYS